MFLLWNETDQIYASPEEFKTKGAAEACARKFRKRFAAQGYYKTACGERISPEDVKLMVKSIEP